MAPEITGGDSQGGGPERTTVKKVAILSEPRLPMKTAFPMGVDLPEISPERHKNTESIVPRGTRRGRNIRGDITGAAFSKRTRSITVEGKGPLLSGQNGFRHR